MDNIKLASYKVTFDTPNSSVGVVTVYASIDRKGPHVYYEFPNRPLENTFYHIYNLYKDKLSTDPAVATILKYPVANNDLEYVEGRHAVAVKILKFICSEVTKL